MVRPCSVHGGSVHQWAAGHRGEHPTRNGLYQQRLVRLSPFYCVGGIFDKGFADRWLPVKCGQSDIYEWMLQDTGHDA